MNQHAALISIRTAMTALQSGEVPFIRQAIRRLEEATEQLESPPLGYTEALETLLLDAGVPITVANRLEKHGYCTVEQLLHATEADLNAHDDLKPGDVRRATAALASFFIGQWAEVVGS